VKLIAEQDSDYQRPNHRLPSSKHIRKSNGRARTFQKAEPNPNARRTSALGNEALEKELKNMTDH